MLVAMLEDNYQLLEAENGLEGLELMHAHADQLSMVLLDIQMPVMNGYQVLEKVSQDAVLREIPIIVTTGNDRAEEEERCLELGATDFIAKPYNPNIVRRRIENIIHLQEKTSALTEVEIDTVIGTYTRSAFVHYASQMLKQNPETDFTLVMSDIIGFQRQVELYGDKAFDILRNEVKAIAERLPENAILGRYAYDQLAILLPTEHAGSDDKALFDYYEENCQKLSEQVDATIKFGVCLHLSRNEKLESYIYRTRKALSLVKHQYGRTVGFVNHLLLERMKRNEEIEMSMEHALKERQLEIYFQPKHHTLTGKLVGAEVLLRWSHPTMGVISSGEFVPIFEQTGFIVEADAFAWSEACRFLKRLHAEGLPNVPLSVNTTRLDFERPGFENRLLQPIRQYNVDPELLHIEVTEQVFAELGNEAISILQRCRDKGMLVELDDFGTGYSSLHSLAELPIDIVKFDQSFVRKLDKPRQLDVMRGCVNLVKRLKLKSVAEGVESEQSRRVVCDLGIDMIQGFFYAKPLPADVFVNYIRQADVMSRDAYVAMEDDPHMAEIDRLRRLAEEDPLTGLNNRYRLYNIVEGRISHKEPFTMVVFDVDNFKHLNDSYGHLVGDNVLVDISNIMRNDFSDCTLIRMGGDEFAIIFDDVVSRSHMQNRMSAFFSHIRTIKVKASVDNARLTLNDSATDVSISAGCISYSGESDTTFEHLYTQADKLLYLSKRTPGCCLNYEGQIDNPYFYKSVFWQ